MALNTFVDDLIVAARATQGACSGSYINGIPEYSMTIRFQTEKDFDRAVHKVVEYFNNMPLRFSSEKMKVPPRSKEFEFRIFDVDVKFSWRDY